MRHQPGFAFTQFEVAWGFYGVSGDFTSFDSVAYLVLAL